MMTDKEYCSPWSEGWRKASWSKLDQLWDIIIVGGGITGAGILALASRSHLNVLLLEQGDFGSGTSSRSSKLVHGGLRYLRHMQIKLTRESVQERQQMLSAVPGLVEPLGFIYPVYKGESPGPWLIELGLGIYTHLASDAGRYRRLDLIDLSMMAPGLKTENLVRGYHYSDGQTDDARLVMRVLHDGLLAGEGRAKALNYCRVTDLLQKGRRVVGVCLRDETTGETAEVRGALVINASGVWANHLRNELGASKRLRPLRGSHLFFSLERFPVYQAIAFSHPDDGRPVFVYPWEGVALVGTTDVDHSLPLDREPSISEEEADYLLRAVRDLFPEFELTKEDVISSQAGVRPVIGTGKTDPSAESRDHVLWSERGLLTVTGGKLTTFRLIAIDALRAGHEINKKIPAPDQETDVFESVEPLPKILSLDSHLSRRLHGRYGRAALPIVRSSPDQLSAVPGTPYLWAELVWAAKNEAVCHLDDLLMRRFRFGILLPDGGQDLLQEMKKKLQSHLGWDNKRWSEEVERYRQVLQVAHGLPRDWKSSQKDKT